MTWIQAAPTEDLNQKGRIVIRHGPRQIAILKLNGHIFALDNRCPHEGYPLHEGTINTEQCVLTCVWHNWKFDLKTGDTLLGEDNVGVYETKSESGSVWIKLPEIPKEKIAAKILDQYGTAFEHQQYGRIARELARLHFNEIDPLIALRKAIEWSYRKLEYGMDHAYAVAADWLTLYFEFPDVERRMICLTEAIDYISETSLRQPDFPYTQTTLPFSEQAFLAAVEQEDEETAIALINGALQSGLHFCDLENALTHAALQHYNDFGHSLIYLTKVRILVDLLGTQVESFLLPALVRSICVATREDLLREFQSFRFYLEKWTSPHSSVSGNLSPDELFGKGLDASMLWTLQHSESTAPEALYQALLHANARSLLHYDMSFQFSYLNSVAKNIGWLDFTHGLTFANAVREQCTRFPKYWKYGLLQMACFIGRNHQFLDPNVREEEWVVADEEKFFEQSLEKLLDHGKSAAIFAAHYIKTFLAVRKEITLADAACRKYMIASVKRFLESPLKEKHIRRTVRQALDLVSRDFVLK